MMMDYAQVKKKNNRGLDRECVMALQFLDIRHLFSKVRHLPPL